MRKPLDGGWFDSPACSIKEGDLVVGINECICASLSPSDAQVLLEAVAEQSAQLSITTLSVPRNEAKGRLVKLRKAAVVAAGGGSLVVCGGALMVTPLHPIGHAMALHSPISSCFAGRMKRFSAEDEHVSRRNPPKPNLVRHPFFDRPTPWWSVGVVPACNYVFVPNTHSLSCLDTVEACCILRLASAACQRHEPSAYFSSICRPFVSLGWCHCSVFVLVVLPL